MRVIGIDPGIGRMGWGVIDHIGNTPTTIAHGCFETKSTTDFPKRLLAIYEFVFELLMMYKPDAVAIEEIFFNTNTTTAFTVGQARGVVIVAAAKQGVPVTSYTPLQVKMAVTGYGRAEKKQVGDMVKILLKLQTVPKPDDTADALAIAITHAFSLKLK